MLVLLVRRCSSALILAAVAASLGYLLAGTGLDPRARLESARPRPPQAAIEAELTALNLNDRTPLHTRYLTWASGAVRGDFGRTLRGTPVSGELPRRLRTSLLLLLPGTVLGAALGVLLGALSALHPGTDKALTVLSHVLLAMPVFVLAVLLQLGAQHVNAATGTHLFQWTGDGTGLASRLQHLVLPTATVALIQAALYSRYQRALMRDLLEAEHVRAARARGLGLHRAFFKHGLRTALVPTTTFFAYDLGLLLLGAAFIEQAYGRHGMGAWLLDSLRQADPHPVAACVALAALLVPAATVLAGAARRLLVPGSRA
ncbi:ABC transporter permease [Actinocorallia aurantiaca]|uniref:ABC transporter permease n=1 Tax=Actinocorallia aurantiaca TaxID=46204 RepID=A0ABP6H2X8_9ACTN